MTSSPTTKKDLASLEKELSQILEKPAKFHQKPTGTFKKQYKKLLRSGQFSKWDVTMLALQIAKLERKMPLDASFLDHALTNHASGDREFHFKPDLLVIYSYIDKVLVLTLGEIGSHSELFD